MSLQAVPSFATATNYPAGANPWNGQPCKVATSGDQQLHGVTPDLSIPAEQLNYQIAQMNSVLAELQTAIAARKVASSVKQNSTFFQWLAQTQIHATIDGANPNAYPSGYTSDAARYTGGSSNASIPDSCTLHAYGTLSGVTSYAYFLSRVPANQGQFVKIQDTSARPLTLDATIPASAAGGWIDLKCDGQGNQSAVVLDAAGIAFWGGIAWNTYTFSAGTWQSLATKPGTGIYAFAANRTAYSTNLGSGSTWTEAAATWDGVAGSPPSSAAMFAPTWDPVNLRWIVGTADLSSSANAVATAKVWTSLDGYTWTTLASTGGMVFVKIRAHQGWLWAIGIVEAAATTGAHFGLEIFVSKDGGVTWIRTGLVLSMAAGATAANYRLRCSLVSAGNFLLAQTDLAGSTEYVILNTNVS